jgi:hypothetical protein
MPIRARGNLPLQALGKKGTRPEWIGGRRQLGKDVKRAKA